MPEPGEYVARGAARQAAWVLAGGAEPPEWPLSGVVSTEVEPTPSVRERYAVGARPDRVAAMNPLDAADPLASYRDRFVGAASPLVYFDGNSLGRPLVGVGPRLARFVEEEWGGRLIRGWDERWMELPQVIGDDLGRVVLGAAPGQTTIGDSTTVLLYKLMRAAVAARPGRTEIVIDRDNFPTDRYVAAGIAEECGLTLRWIDVDLDAGVTPDAARRRRRAGDRARRPLARRLPVGLAGRRAGADADRPRRRRPGALGPLPLRRLRAGALDEWGVDLAVGCTYKYLNGGPGSPAFCYVAVEAPGVADAADPGLARLGRPVPDGAVVRARPGHPPLRLRDAAGRRHARDAGHGRADRVGRHRAVREKSVALTSYAI